MTQTICIFGEHMIGFDHVSSMASSEWLTSELAANGYLLSGRVAAVDQRVSRIGATMTSTFYQLDINYTPDFAGTAPSSCLMKVGYPELFAVTKEEAAFYDRARRNGPTDGLVTAFATAVSEDAQSAVILLEDRVDCHPPSEWPLPPTLDLCERAIRSLATVHARWWNSPELSDPLFERMTDRWMSAEERSKLLSSFFESLSDRLTQSRRTTLENLSDKYPDAVHRRLEQTNFQTLVHGDAHFWNFLYPADASLRPVLIDWQSFSVHFAAYDLAYMIGLHWFPERRERFEEALLHAYHDELHTQGIDYSFDDLWFDYRLQVAGLLFLPIIQWSDKAPALIWWPHLERAFSVFDELDCRELL